MSSKCPQTERAFCRLCGPWLGWRDLRNPGRSPTRDEWAKCCVEIQAHHDKLWQKELDSLSLKC